MGKGSIEPTGDPLDLEDKEYCSVVMTTEAMKIKVEGKFRQRERKLFVLLIHSVWDNIGVERLHTIELAKIKHVFREIAGVKGFNNWLWEYLKNLAEVKITFESEYLRGVTRLVSSVKFDEKKEHVTFEIPKEIEDSIKSPNQYARLDTYFLIGLKGKYSVSLYQLLESKVNLRKFDPEKTLDEDKRYIQISLEELRNWLAIEKQYKLWGHFKSRVLDPAVSEINANPIASTFTVRTEEVKGKRNKVIAIKFFLTKTRERLVLEESIQVKKEAKEAARASTLIPCFSGTKVYDRAKKIVPSDLDIYQLEEEWREFAYNRNEEVKNPEGAWLGWLKKKYKVAV